MKNGSGCKQARILLNLSALVPLELKQAEAKAWELAAQKAQGRFRWEDWNHQKVKLERMTAADWIEKYRLHRDRQGMDEDTWKRHYWAVYKKLPLDQLLTETNILEAVLQSAPNSRTAHQLVSSNVGCLFHKPGTTVLRIPQ